MSIYQKDVFYWFSNLPKKKKKNGFRVSEENRNFVYKIVRRAEYTDFY